MPALREALEDAGRDPAEVKVVPFGTLPDAGKLAYYGQLGIEEVVLNVPSAPADTVLPLLDRYAAFL